MQELIKLSETSYFCLFFFFFLLLLVVVLLLLSFLSSVFVHYNPLLLKLFGLKFADIKPTVGRILLSKTTGFKDLYPFKKKSIE